MDMDFGTLFSSLMISLIGMAMMMFGRKASKTLFVLGGLAICVYPYFISNIFLSWGILILVVTLMYFFRDFFG